MPALQDKRHERFCLYFVSDPKRDGSEAYKAAGFKAVHKFSAAANSCRLMKNPRIQERIAELEEAQRKIAVERYGVTQERVLEELAAVAFSDPADLLDEDGKLLPIKQMPERVRRAIASIEWLPTGAVKVKLWPKATDALDKLAKHLNLYKEHNKEGAGVVMVQLNNIQRDM